MLTAHVAIVSEESSITAAELTTVAGALSKQVSRDFGPLWEVNADVAAYQRLEDVPLDYWPIIVKDDIGDPSAAGYHEDQHGQPLALVQYDTSWSLTASHECLEMLADPFGRRVIAGESPVQGQGRVNFLVEVCDPCEASGCAYTINGVQVSDFFTPHFFDPELLPISQNQALLPDAVAKPLNVPWPARALQALLRRLGIGRHAKIDSHTYGLFVDGGVTPHNNPSLALFHMATLSPFKIKWQTGPKYLTIFSVGTGTYRPRLSYESLGFARFTKLAFHALISLMTDSEMLVLSLMQWMGECPAPWQINSEVGTLADDLPPGGKMFRFLRYDVRLEKDWLARELNYDVSDDALARLRGMDDPAAVHQLYEIGRMAAEKQVKIEHLTG